MPTGRRRSSQSCVGRGFCTTNPHRECRRSCRRMTTFLHDGRFRISDRPHANCSTGETRRRRSNVTDRCRSRRTAADSWCHRQCNDRWLHLHSIWHSVERYRMWNETYCESLENRNIERVEMEGRKERIPSLTFHSHSIQLFAASFLPRVFEDDIIGYVR